MRVMNAAEFLQAAPSVGATARFAHQRVVDDHFLQAIVAVDHQQARHLFGQVLRLARQEFRRPAAGRRSILRAVPWQNTWRSAGRSRREIDQREGDGFRHQLLLRVLIIETLHRPIEIHLAVGFEREPRCPVGPRRRIVAECRERPRFRGRRSREIGRQVAAVRAGVHAEQGRPAIGQAARKICSRSWNRLALLDCNT